AGRLAHGGGRGDSGREASVSHAAQADDLARPATVRQVVGLDGDGQVEEVAAINAAIVVVVGELSRHQGSGTAPDVGLAHQFKLPGAVAAEDLHAPPLYPPLLGRGD